MTKFTKQELYGKKRGGLYIELTGWLLPILGIPLAMIFLMERHPLENKDSGLLIFAAGYALGFLGCVVFKRHLFPYEKKAPVITWLGVLSMSFLVAMLVLSLVMVCNAYFSLGI